ncbi:unnamed protein product, partial [marine sediment metagenome]
RMYERYKKSGEVVQQMLFNGSTGAARVFSQSRAKGIQWTIFSIFSTIFQEYEV